MNEGLLARIIRCVRFALCLLALMGVVSAVPSPAYATFADAAQSFPAMQDLGTFDDPIYGDQIPDGTYQVTARTSSSMCIFYTDPAHAEARDSKEQAIISVENGNITAIFYISKAYNYLYMGTQEEAAAATNAEGTDASAYIAGDPPEGYVPHLFTMAVPALNVPITFSSFSGGDKGIERGVWYTREVVFGMSASELEAIVANAAGEPVEPEPEPEPENQAEEPATQEGVEEEAPAEDEEPTSEEDSVQPELRTDNVNTGEEGSGSGSGDADAQAAEPSEEDGSGDSAKNAGNTIPVGAKATRMSIAGAAGSIDIELDAPEEAEDIEKPLLTARQILGLAWLGFLVAGIILRVALFKRGYDRVGRLSRGSPPEPPVGFKTKGAGHKSFGRVA